MSEPERVWNLLGKRWTPAILQCLDSTGVLRFTELKRSLDGISGTMLSERLLDLEAQGLVTKDVYSSVPPKVEYSLTASAKELALIMKQVISWHARWSSKNDMCEILSMPAR